jgi:hypothetical protein
LDNGDESILKNDEYKNDVKYGFNDAFLAVHYKLLPANSLLTQG